MEILEKYNKYSIEGTRQDLANLLIGVIINSQKNNVIRVVYRYYIEEELPNENKDDKEIFPIEVINAIRDFSAVAGADISVKQSYVGGYQKITNVDNTNEVNGNVQLNKQIKNTP